MSLTIRDAVVDLMQSLEPIDGDPGPEVPAEITYDIANHLTHERLAKLKVVGYKHLCEGRREVAWGILEQCRKAVEGSTLILDAVAIQNRSPHGRPS